MNICRFITSKININKYRTARIDLEYLLINRLPIKLNNENNLQMFGKITTNGIQITIGQQI
jgi:hypothetical protein